MYRATALILSILININIGVAEQPDQIKLPSGLVECIDAFELAFKEKNYRKAIEQLEMIPQAFAGQILPVKPGSLLNVPVSLFVLHSLDRFPFQVVKDYRKLVDIKATENLQNYRNDFNRDHLDEILRLFPLSSTAVAALRIIAELDFEQGNTLAAGFVWSWIQKLSPKNRSNAFTDPLEEFVGILNGRELRNGYGSQVLGNGQRTKKIQEILQSIQHASEEFSKRLVSTIPHRKISKNAVSKVSGVGSLVSVHGSYKRPDLNPQNKISAVRQGTVLAAYDQTGGKCWDATHVAAGTVNEEFLKKLQFMSNPVTTEDSFVVSATSISGELQSIVISFAKDTGIIRWQKTVALSADDRHLGLGGVPSTPIYQQGLLFVNTNSGVIAAIKNSGELLWNSRYPQFKAGVLNRSVRFEEIWNYGSIHLLQGYLVVAPQDASYLYIIDVLTGQIKSKTRRESYAKSSVFQNESILLDGSSETSCLNVRTGKVEWKRENLGNLVPTRPGLARNLKADSSLGDFVLKDGEVLEQNNVVVSDRLVLYEHRERVGRLQSEINATNVVACQLGVLELNARDLQSELAVGNLQEQPKYSTKMLDDGEVKRGEQITKVLSKKGDLFRSLYLSDLSNDIRDAVIPEEVFCALSRFGSYQEKLFRSGIKWYEDMKFQDDLREATFAALLSKYVIQQNVLARLDEDMISRVNGIRNTLAGIVKDMDALKVWYRKNPLCTANVQVVDIGKQLIALAIRKVPSNVGSLELLNYGHFREMLFLDRYTGEEKFTIELKSGVTGSKDIYVGQETLVVKERSAVAAYSLSKGEVVWEFGGRPKEDSGLLYQRHEFEGISVASQKAVVITSSGKVFCLSINDGGVLWTLDLKKKGMRLAGIQAGRAIIVDKKSSNFVVINCSDGSILLRSKEVSDEAIIPGAVSILDDCLVTFSRSQVFQNTGTKSNGTVRCYSLGTGKELWQLSTAYRIGELTILPGKKVMIAPPTWARTGIINVLDGNSGKILWTYQNLGSRCQGFSTGSDKLYIVANKDLETVLTCFDIQSGKQQWVQSLENVGGRYSVFEHRDMVGVYTQTMPQLSLFNVSTGSVYGKLSFKGRSRVEIKNLPRGLLVCNEREIYELALDGMKKRNQSSAAESQKFDWDSGNRARMANNLRGFYQNIDKARREGKLRIKKDSLKSSLSLLYGNAARGKREIRISKLSRQIEVDGEMKDSWPASARIPLKSLKEISLVENGDGPDVQCRGENDLSGDLYLGWDSKHLYIAVDVSDDVAHSFSSESEVWKGDGLMIAIDPDLDGGFGYNGKDYVFTQALMAKKPDKEEQDEGDEAEPEGQYAVHRRRDGSGTVYESAIPWKYLARIVPSAGSRFGFNIYVTDDDSGHGASKGLVLSPGICLDRRRSLFSRGYTPELFAEIVLEE